MFPLGLLVFAVLGWLLLLVGEAGRDVWLAVWALYGAVVATAGALAGLRFRSLRVGALAAAGVPAVHLTYAVAVVHGVLGRHG
jgi:hypothetical protein